MLLPPLTVCHRCWRQPEGDQISERVELDPEFTLRACHACDASIGHVEKETKADGYAGCVKLIAGGREQDG